MGHISLFLVVKIKGKFPSWRPFYPKFSKQRNIKCLTEERTKKLPKETVRCIYSFIHFFVLCPKSIPFLYFSLDHNGNYLRWHDHFRSISGIICSLRIICGWGSFTILYRSPVTNDAISCNYSNYCIQNKHKNSYENDTDDTQYLIDDTLIAAF